tara:strand:+ start:1856 stop:2767 length:912 start_codon:yes stop_codon:yes gene_type:complete
MSQDHKCAPNKQYNNGSCFSIKDLKKIALAYNNFVDDSNLKKKKIDLNTENKKILLEQLTTNLSKTCNNQMCWLKQKYVKDLNDSELNNTFRPKGPDGKVEWLSTTHINDVMGQYEKKYKDFKFFGAVPNDFDNLPFLGIKDTNYDKLLGSGKKKIGYVFNLDEHWKSGSHWVAMYGDLNKNQLYFFDSYGKKPDKRVRTLAKRIAKWMYKKDCKKCKDISDSESVMNSANAKDTFKNKVEVDYNHNRHQYKNSECGVYSMNFIIRLLNGESFKNITENKTLDDPMNRCRDKYFTLSKPFDKL